MASQMQFTHLCFLVASHISCKKGYTWSKSRKKKVCSFTQIEIHQNKLHKMQKFQNEKLLKQNQRNVRWYPVFFFFFLFQIKTCCLLPFRPWGVKTFSTSLWAPGVAGAFGLQVRGNATSPSLRRGLWAHILGWKSSTVRPNRSIHPPLPFSLLSTGPFSMSVSLFLPRN